MIKQNRMMKRIVNIAVLLMLGTSMSACAGFLGFGSDSWKEEVLLHDGSKIVVNRSQSYGGRHEVGQALPIREHTVSFTLPSSGRKLTWTSEYGEDIGRTNFKLLALHILNGTPYIVASPNLCLSYNKWGRPNPPYVIFKHDGEEWQRISMDKFPVEFKTVNIDFGMTWAMRDREVKFDKGDMLSAETIRRHNEESHQLAYQTILHVPTPSDGGPGVGCSELIYDGRGGWQGPGLFSRQPSKEACIRYCKQREITDQYCPCNRFFK